MLAPRLVLSLAPAWSGPAGPRSRSCCTACPFGTLRHRSLVALPASLQRGLLDPEKEDPFSLFVASTNIRYCYYSDTHKVLGNTYGMLVLQACRGSAGVGALRTVSRG